MADDAPVTVIFIDGADGREVGRSDLHANQLPEAFDADSTVDIAGTTWLVEHAEPEGAAQRFASRTLTLTLRRASFPAVPAHNILYSLPSICDVLPPTTDASNGERASALKIHEDDWRQVELVAGSLTAVVQSELRAIKAIHDAHARRADDGVIVGFDAIHVRSQPARPLPGRLPLTRALNMLPQPDRQYAGVAFTDAAGVVAGSFAMAFGQLNLYGLADSDVIEVLCLDRGAVTDAGSPRDLIPALQELMETFDLVIADWCRCALIGPASAAAYLK